MTIFNPPNKEQINYLKNKYPGIDPFDFFWIPRIGDTVLEYDTDLRSYEKVIVRSVDKNNTVNGWLIHWYLPLDHILYRNLIDFSSNI